MTGVGRRRLGERVRTLRQQRGLTQTELAGKGLSASYVSLIEAGKRDPTPDMLARLAERLHVDAEYLRSGADPVDALRLRTDLALAKLALNEGRPQEALALLERAAGAEGRTLLPPQEAFDAQLTCAGAHERLGDLRAAVGLLESLRADAESSDGDVPWLPIVVSLARCYRDAGDAHRAVDLAEAALTRCEQVGLVGVDAHTQLVSTLAGIYGDRGDLLRATTLLDTLLLQLDGDATQQRGYAYWNAAMTAAERGERGEALRLVERASALIAEGDDDRNHARIKVARASIMLSQDPPDALAARALLRTALPALRRYAGVEGVAKAETQLARAEVALNRPTVARRHAVSAVARLGDGQPLAAATAHAAHAEALLALGNRPEAIRALENAARLLMASQSPRQASGLWRQLAESYKGLGRPEQAMAALERALDALGVVAEPARVVSDAEHELAASDPAGRHGVPQDAT